MEQLYTSRYLVSPLDPVLEDGALVVRGGQIVAVGRRDALRRRHPTAAITEFGDAILLPPLVNAHTHLELTEFDSWAADQPVAEGFVGWVKRLIQVKRGLDPECYAASLQAGLQQALQAGTGAVGDILSWLPGRPAYQETPLYGRVFYETLGRYPDITERSLAELGRLLDEGPCGRFTAGLAPHSPYTLSADYLRRVYAYAEERDLPVTTHLAESQAEVTFLADSSGPLADELYPLVGWQELVPPPAQLRPLTYLARHGGLTAHNLLVHGVEVTSAEVHQIAASGAHLVLCPRSNACLGGGRAPLAAYLAAGVSLALGTDSRASVASLSVWDEIAFARDWFAGQATPDQLLTMATVGGARALGLDGAMGRLRPGWGAHFQVLRPAALPPGRELLEFLTSPGRTAEVAALYLAGRDVLQ